MMRPTLVDDRSSAKGLGARLHAVLSVFVVALLTTVSVAALASPAQAQFEQEPFVSVVAGRLLAGSVPLEGVQFSAADTTGVTGAEGDFGYQENRPFARDVTFSSSQTLERPNFDVSLSPSLQECPEGFAPDELLGGTCARFEDAELGPESCPEGSRGEPGACYILLARGPATCDQGEPTPAGCRIAGPTPEPGPLTCPVGQTVDLDPVTGECYTLISPPAGAVTCAAPYVLIGVLCRASNPGSTPAEIAAFACPPATADVVVTETTSTVGDVTIVDSCSYTPIARPGVCPPGTTADGLNCRRAVDLVRGPDTCAEGFGLDDGDCVTYENPVVPDCPEGSVEDDEGNCRKPVANSSGSYFCEDPAAALNGRSCVFIAPYEPREIVLPDLTQVDVVVVDDGCGGRDAIDVVCDQYLVEIAGDFRAAIIQGIEDFPVNGSWSSGAVTSDGSATLPVFALPGAEILIRDEFESIVASIVWDGSPSVTVPIGVEPNFPDLEIRFDIVRENGEVCPADFDAATSGAFDALVIESGEELTYCFAVKNFGPETAFNVRISYLSLGFEFIVGELAAGEEASVSRDGFGGPGLSIAGVFGVDQNGVPIESYDEARTALPNPDVGVSLGEYVLEDVNGTVDVIVTVVADQENPVSAVEFSLDYDPTLIEPVLVDGLPDCTILLLDLGACGPPNPTGTVRVAGFTTSLFDGPTQVLSIPFRALGSEGVSALQLEDVVLYDFDGIRYYGAIGLDGLLTIEAPSPVPTCLGKPVTIDMRDGSSGIGTSGDDVIRGTGNADVIKGRGGNDTICAGGGDDLVRGGSGDDLISAGAGDDKVYGDSGDDDLRGGSGDDDIRGGRDNDIVRAGTGEDTVRGGSGDDDLRGGGDNDRIWGHSGNDVLRGQNGDDDLRGGFGNDDLYGGAGADTCIGSVGSDLVRCEVVRGRSER